MSAALVWSCMTANQLQPDDAAENMDAGPTAAETVTITNLRAELNELQGEMRIRTAREAMVRSLAVAGARSPELLFPAVRDRLQLAADGTAENSAALISALKHEFPEQFRSATQPTSIDAASGAAGARPLTKEALAKMTPEQISRLDWSVVRRVLSNS